MPYISFMQNFPEKLKTLRRHFTNYGRPNSRKKFKMACVERSGQERIYSSNDANLGGIQKVI